MPIVNSLKNIQFMIPLLNYILDSEQRGRDTCMCIVYKFALKLCDPCMHF